MNGSGRNGARRLTFVALGAASAALLLSCAPAGAARMNARNAPAEEVDRIGAGLRSVEIRAGGRSRNYLIYVPSSYRPGRPTPLVLSFHGGGDSADKMAQYTQYPSLAEAEGFIVVFPNGTYGRRANGGTWNTGSGKGMGQAEKRGVDDRSFVRAMLDDLKSDYTIDPDRVFVTGMSKGGMMTYYVACNFADEVAAIAPISTTMVTSRCEPTSPVAVLHVHGTDDRSVPLNGGRGDNTGGGYDYPPVSRAIDFWRNRDRCSAEKTVSKAGPETTCTTWRNCVREVTLCLIDRGGHAWPGQKKMRWQKMLDVYVAQSYDATLESWRFFEQHPKQR